MIDKRLTETSFPIVDLPLCHVRLKDNKNYPWVILIPRVSDITELFQLSPDEQTILMHEITQTSRIMHAYFKPDKLNVATIGNIVSQLHIHVIARYQHDALWPHSVWQSDVVETPYEPHQHKQVINTLRELLS